MSAIVHYLIEAVVLSQDTMIVGRLKDIVDFPFLIFLVASVHSMHCNGFVVNEKLEQNTLWGNF